MDRRMAVRSPSLGIGMEWNRTCAIYSSSSMIAHLTTLEIQLVQLTVNVEFQFYIL